jgi:predicted lysophospholipase L1 biosynthesis ABC-type transport system permease subunit
MRNLTYTVAIASVTLASLELVDANYLAAALLLTLGAGASVARHLFALPED